MSWVSVGFAGVSAASSIAGASAQNKRAGEQFKDSVDRIKKDYQFSIGQIQEQMKSEDEAIRLEMTSQRFNGLQATAVTSNTLVEREIAGNTARKLYNQSNINKQMAHNVLAKKAEDSMVSFGMEMKNKQIQANNAIYGAEGQAQSNYVSTTKMATGAISAGIKGYQMGSSLSGMFEETGVTSSIGTKGGIGTGTGEGSSLNPSTIGQYNGTSFEPDSTVDFNLYR